MEPKQEPKRKRFLLVKLEDRIVPSHLPAVADVVVASPAVELAPTHAHKVDLALRALPPTSGSDQGSGSGHFTMNHNETLVGDMAQVKKLSPAKARRNAASWREEETACLRAFTSRQRNTSP